MNTSSNGSSLRTAVDISGILHISGITANQVLGVPINSCILWLILTGPAGTMASELFTLNLSVCEIVFSLLYLLVHLLPDILRYILRYDDWTMFHGLVYFTNGFLFSGRPVFQCCICVERFMAVVHPMLFLRYKPLRYRAACSALAWLLIVGLSALQIPLGGNETGYMVYVGQVLFFMSVMMFCSLSVLWVLKRPGPGDRTATTPGRERDRDRDNNDGAKRRAFAIIGLIMVSFVATYLVWGFAVAIFSSRGFRWSRENGLLQNVLMFVTVVTGFVQPLLYLCQRAHKLPRCTGQGA